MKHTVAELVVARARDRHPGLVGPQGTATHAEVVAAAAERAACLLQLRGPGPFHVAFLLDNSPEFLFWLEAAALVGAVMVGGNPTHRGEELVRDLSHTECQLLVVEERHLPLLEGRRVEPLGIIERESARVLVVEQLEGVLAAHRGTTVDDVFQRDVAPDDLGYLLFTSGTSGAPKACRCTQGRMASIGQRAAEMLGLRPDDVCYLAMPLFHSNALMAGWAPSLAAGAAAALPSTGRFSASGFLGDVRRFGVTYFNYVGKPLSYLLATPEAPDDADNPLRLVFGNEAAPGDVERFSQRFGCPVIDAYGSTEGGATVSRTADTPPGALGRAPEGTVVLDPETGEECPPARFDERGRLLNAEEAIGELVNRGGGAAFEGYWRNDEAEAARSRHGWYWTGDLAYRDEAGFFYFAGRDHDWLRVDGENFAAAPVERILLRHPDVVVAAVYAVPDPAVGDQVMAALQLRPDAPPFDPEAFDAFLGAQDDLGTKWSPTFVRVTEELPVTATAKVLKRQLRQERWHTDDPIWWRPGRGQPFRRLEAEDVAALDAAVGDRVA